MSLLPLDISHQEASFSDGSSSEHCDDNRPKPSPQKKAKKTPKGRNKNATVAGAHTVESVLVTWNEMTDYGKSFRAMAEADQTKEVLLLNKGAANGMKGMIKTKMLSAHFKTVVEIREVNRAYCSMPHETCSNVSQCPQNKFIIDHQS